MSLTSKVELPSERWTLVRKASTKYPIYHITFMLDDSLHGTYVTPDGSLLKLGKILHNYIREGSVPIHIDRKVLTK